MKGGGPIWRMKSLATAYGESVRASNGQVNRCFTARGSREEMIGARRSKTAGRSSNLADAFGRLVPSRQTPARPFAQKSRAVILRCSTCR